MALFIFELMCICAHARPPSRVVTMSTIIGAKPIIFYDSGSCPYAHRTWLALEEKLLPYETIKVDLQNKSKVRCFQPESLMAWAPSYFVWIYLCI